MKSIREKVLAFAVKADQKGLCHDTVGNFSICDRRSGLVVITPSGRTRGACSPADMCVVDMDGSQVECPFKPSIETPLHLKIYQTLPAVGAVVHVHSPHAAAFAVARREIGPYTEETSKINGRVPLAAYAPAGTSQLADNALRHLVDFPAVLLANHGLVTIGKDMEEAFLRALITEDLAKTVIFAHILGSPHMLK